MKHIPLWSSLALLLSLTLVSCNEATPPQTLTSEGLQDGSTYTFTAKHSNFNLDVPGSRADNGLQLQQYTPNGTAAQQFILEDAGDGRWTIMSKASSKALEINGGDKTQGSAVQQWGKANAPWQTWLLVDKGDDYYIIKNAYTGLVMDVSEISKKSGAKVQQWSEHGGDNQLWKLTEVAGNSDLPSPSPAPTPTPPTDPSNPPASGGRDNLIEEITEQRVKWESGKGGEGCQGVREVSSPTRAGSKAFEHWVKECGERSEFSMRRVQNGGAYWYGWSYFIPDDTATEQQSFTILNQFAPWPAETGVGEACGGVGSMVVLGIQGKTAQFYGRTDPSALAFAFQRTSEGNRPKCDVYKLADISEVKGKWVDLVMEVKWTGNDDGFIRLWLQIDRQGWERTPVFFEGVPTYWDRDLGGNEVRGPYFKMGAYKGDPGWQGEDPFTVYTDEYRLGSDRATFSDVSADRTFPAGQQ